MVIDTTTTTTTSSSSTVMSAVWARMGELPRGGPEKGGIEKGGMKCQSPSVQNQCGNLCCCLTPFFQTTSFRLKVVLNMSSSHYEKYIYIYTYIHNTYIYIYICICGGITCLTLLVYYGLAYFLRVSSCHRSPSIST